MKNYILEELNIKELTLAQDDSAYGVKLTSEPDNDRLGKRFKKEFKVIAPAIKSNYIINSIEHLIIVWLDLTDNELRTFQETGEITVNGHLLTREDIHVLLYIVFFVLNNFSSSSCHML